MGNVDAASGMQARHEDNGAPADLRRAVPLADAGRMPDDVQRMQEFLRRHPHVSWLRPGTAGVTDQTATWIETSADPRVDGTPVTVSRFWLGQLVDYLEARFSGAS